MNLATALLELAEDLQTLGRLMRALETAADIAEPETCTDARETMQCTTTPRASCHRQARRFRQRGMRTHTAATGM